MNNQAPAYNTRAARAAQRVRTQTNSSSRSQATSRSPTRSPGRSPGRSPARSPGRSPARSPGRSPARSPGRTPPRSPGRSPARSPGRTPPGSPPTPPPPPGNRRVILPMQMEFNCVPNTHIAMGTQSSYLSREWNTLLADWQNEVLILSDAFEVFAGHKTRDEAFAAPHFRTWANKNNLGTDDSILDSFYFHGNKLVVQNDWPDEAIPQQDVLSGKVILAVMWDVPSSDILGFIIFTKKLMTSASGKTVRMLIVNVFWQSLKTFYEPSVYPNIHDVLIIEECLTKAVIEYAQACQMDVAYFPHVFSSNPDYLLSLNQEYNCVRLGTKGLVCDLRPKIDYTTVFKVDPDTLLARELTPHEKLNLVPGIIPKKIITQDERIFQKETPIENETFYPENITMDPNQSSCYDVVEFDDVDISETIKNPDMLFFVDMKNRQKGHPPKTYCYSYKELLENTFDPNNWRLECNGPRNGTNTGQTYNIDDPTTLGNGILYVRVPLQSLFFFDRDALIGALQSEYRVFYMYPLLDTTTHAPKVVTHSISYHITHYFMDDPELSSSAHCQDGSALGGIYELRVCDDQHYCKMSTIFKKVA